MSKSIKSSSEYVLPRDNIGYLCSIVSNPSTKEEPTLWVGELTSKYSGYLCSKLINSFSKESNSKSEISGKSLT